MMVYASYTVNKKNPTRLVISSHTAVTFGYHSGELEEPLT